MWQDDLAQLFPIKSQSSDGDRYWLAALYQYTRQLHQSYNYLEVGSYLGGTLTPALLDDRCLKVLSIDLRPKIQPDARGAHFDYSHVNTAAMLEVLKKTPGLNLSKLKTFDGDAGDYSFADQKFEFALIDAEHTDEAVVTDFLAVVDHLAENAICAFHDSNLITAGLSNIGAMMKYLRRPHRFIMFQHSSVSAMFVGAHANMLPPDLVSGEWNWDDFREKSRDQLLLQAAQNRLKISFKLNPTPVLPADPA